MCVVIAAVLVGPILNTERRMIGASRLTIVGLFTTNNGADPKFLKHLQFCR